MNYTLQWIPDLIQTIIIVGLIMQNVSINKEINELKIRLHTIIKTDHWIHHMRLTSIKKPKESEHKQEK